MERNSDLYSHSHRAACQALVYSLLQRCEPQTGPGTALALVSAHPGAGVSHIQSLLEEMLNDNEAGCAIGLDCDALGIIRDPREDFVEEASAHRESGRGRRKNLTRRAAVARYRDRVGHLNRLRDQYRYTLLDCHSLRERTDVLGLAPVVSGVIVVAESDRTTAGQLDELERSVERYGGKIFGSVLNKTTDPIPRWFNRLMEKAGI